MVSIEEMEQIIHNEEMAKRRAKLKPIQEKIRQKEAEDKELFKWKGYTLTDVAREINPPRSKILDAVESNDRLMEAHALGMMHGIAMKLGAMALFCLIYVL